MVGIKSNENEVCKKHKHRCLQKSKKYAKLFLIKLQREDRKGHSSIHTIRGVLRPAFQMAVDDDL